MEKNSRYFSNKLLSSTNKWYVLIFFHDLTVIYFMLLSVDGSFFYLAKRCPGILFLVLGFKLSLNFEEKMLVGLYKSEDFLVSVCC